MIINILTYLLYFCRTLRLSVSNGYRTSVLQLVVDFCHKDPYLIVPFRYIVSPAISWRLLWGADRTTATKPASVRKQLGSKNSKRKEGRQEKNGGVQGRDGSAEDLARETGKEHATMGRMADDILPKRAAELREEGRRRRGRPMLRSEDCVKRGVRKAGKEEDWKKKTRDR